MKPLMTARLYPSSSSRSRETDMRANLIASLMSLCNGLAFLWRLSWQRL